MGRKTKNECTRWIKNKAYRIWEVARHSDDFGTFVKRLDCKEENRQYFADRRLSISELRRKVGDVEIIRVLLLRIKPIELLKNESKWGNICLKINLDFPDDILLENFKSWLQSAREIKKLDTSTGKIEELPRPNRKWKHFNTSLLTYEATSNGISKREIAEILHPNLSRKSAMRRIERDNKLFLEYLKKGWRHM